MKTQNLRIMFLAWLVPWSGLACHPSATPASQERSILADTSDKPTLRCDFSAYSPVPIQHFGRKAIIKRVQPEYPDGAIQGRIQGRVAVKVLVNERGLVERACAIEGDQLLRTAAEKAALQWQFKPGYGLAFIRPKTEKNPKNFAEAYIVFEFKLDKSGSKGTAGARP